MDNTLSRRVRRGVAVGGVALVALAGGGLATAGTANADGKNGTLERFELGLYYGPNFQGPVFDLLFRDADFSNDAFPGTIAPANDNTASVWNTDIEPWTAFTGANWSGASVVFDAGYKGNLADPGFRNQLSSAFPAY